MIKSRRMKWMRCSTHRREEMHTTFLSENLKGRDHSENIGVDGRIILDWILGRYGGVVWTVFIWLRIGTSGVLL
jgi:hypothetical protein